MGRLKARGSSLLVEQQLAAGDDHLLARRDEVDGVGLDHDAVGDAMDRQRRLSAEQLVHAALEVRRQVLQDDEGHPRVARHGGEEALERVEAARRGADADDQEVRCRIPLFVAHPKCTLFTVLVTMGSVV